MDFKADLHMHSYFSDGTMSPEELLHLAKEKKLSGISITDHDTIDGYTDKIFQLARNLDIMLLQGVEISSEFSSSSVHILGYGFDLKSKAFQDFLLDIQERKRQRNVKILEKLRSNNIQITEEELYEYAKEKGVNKTIVGRPHIASLMLEKKYIANIQEGFDRFLKDDGMCYVAGDRVSSELVVKKLHEANGIAILAHPHLIKSKKLLKKLLNLGFDGIEVYYGRLPFYIETNWKKIAEDNNLLITGGSDFHGSIKPHISLGCSWVDKDVFNEILKHV